MTGEGRRRRTRGLLQGVALAALSGLAGLAHAADSPPAPDALQEALVKGSLRRDRLQPAPGSVQTLSSETLERSQARTFDDLVRLAPALTITKPSQPANNSINIRGIGAYAFSIGVEPSVAVLVDGVPLSIQAAAFASLVDVERVEVLRGPQGTLFGRSASAGVVRLTTASATPVFAARAEALVTDDHEYRLSGFVSGPLGPTLRARLAAAFSDDPGQLRNLGTGRFVNGQSDTVLRGRLEWSPAPDLDVILTPYYLHTVASCCQNAWAFLSPGVTFSRGAVPRAVILDGIDVGPANRRVRTDVNARGNAVNAGAVLRVESAVGDLRLTSLTGYDRYDLHDLQDTDTSAFDFRTLAPQAPAGGSANGGVFKINALNQELRLASAEGARLRFLAGLAFNRTGSTRVFVRGSNTLGGYNGLSALPTTNSTAFAAYAARTWEATYAAFGQASYPLHDRLDLIAGLRITHERQRYRFEDLVNGVTFCATTSPTLPVRTCHDDTGVTGKLGFEHRTGPGLTTFAAYTWGRKGSAFDLSSTLTIRTPVAAGPRAGLPVADVVAAGQPVRPEHVEALELGARLTAFEGRLSARAAVFDQRYRGFQAQSRDPSSGQSVLNSVGRVRSRGAEAEASLQFGPDIVVDLAVTYAEARILSFPRASCYVLQTVAQGCVGGQQDLSGRPLPNAPRWNVSLSGRYDLPPVAADIRPFLTASVKAQSRVVYNLLQDPASRQPGYGLLNLGVGLDADRWKVTVFANNVLNQRYALSRGRDGVFNLAPAAVTNPTDGYVWKPARDSFRYFGLRVAAAY